MSESNFQTVGTLNFKSTSDFVFVCDHGGNSIPVGYENLGLDENELERHIAYDIGALGVATKLAESFRAPLVWQKCSRLLIDCNRRLDHVDLIPTRSDGTLIPGNRLLDEKSGASRIGSFFMPYHQKITEMLDRRHMLKQKTFFVSVHSFTPIMDGYRRPWDVGILSTKNRIFSDHVMRYIENFKDYCVGDNEPYKIDSKDFTVPEHAVKRMLSNVLIEIRQDLIQNREGQEIWSRLIRDALLSAKEKVL